jgi:CRP/FNR family transcriptional regulator, cyclic AMP receptor protein
MRNEERPWFDRLSDADRQALIDAGRTRVYAPRTVIMEEGLTTGLVVVVRSGRVTISTLSSDGHETTLAAIGRGEVIGEFSAVDGRPHSATATTIEEVEALVISAPAFRDVVATHAGLAFQLLHSVVGRLRDSDRVRVEFGGRDAVQRVCALLLWLAREHGEVDDTGGIRISTAFSQEEMATWVGASREAVNKALRRLRAQGLVETGRREVVVRDLRRLMRLAER